MLAKFIANKLVSKCTFVISNLFGPPLPLIIKGKKSTKMQCLLPGLCGIAGGFGIISHVDTIKISF